MDNNTQYKTIITMPSSVDSIRLASEYQTIQPYTGEPDYDTNRSVYDKLKTNAASIPSALGGRNHGLLGLIMSDATYLLVSTTAFVHPPNPGLLPHIPTDATAAISDELVRQHKAILQMFHEVQHTDRALKQQLIETFDAIYTYDLRDPNIGFTGTTAITIITHLYGFFGKISAADLAKNDEDMVTPYDSSTPITKLFSQIEEAVFYSKLNRVKAKLYVSIMYRLRCLIMELYIPPSSNGCVGGSKELKKQIYSII